MYQGGLTHDAAFDVRFPPVGWKLLLAAKNNGGFAFDGARLFVDDFASELLALDPRDGSVLWRARADDVLMSTPIVADGMVFVGSGTSRPLVPGLENTILGRPAGNHWYAYRAATGALVWSHRTAGEAMPSAAYAGGRLIYATGNDVATALDARTGAVLWRTPLPGLVSMASAMVDGDTFFVIATRGKNLWNDPRRSHTLAIDVRTGTVRWSRPFGNADCTPAVAGGLVFVEGERDGPHGRLEPIGTNVVTALDERTGALRWSYRSAPGIFTGVGTKERAIAGTYHAGVLYQSLPAVDEIIAFEAKDGRVLWQVHTSAPVKMSPLVYRGHVYAGDTAGILYDLDAKTGAANALWPFAKPFTSAPFLIVGKTMFISDSDVVEAFPLQNLRTGVGP